MIVLSFEDMVNVNVAPVEIRHTQDVKFVQRLQRNVPIHMTRIYRWSKTPIGRYAIYTGAIAIFPHKKINTFLRIARKTHGIIESSKSIYEDVQRLF